MLERCHRPVSSIDDSSTATIGPDSQASAPDTAEPVRRLQLHSWLSKSAAVFLADFSSAAELIPATAADDAQTTAADSNDEPTSHALRHADAGWATDDESRQLLEHLSR